MTISSHFRIKATIALTLIAGAFASLTSLMGCAMEHEAMENPSSEPINPIDFEAVYVVNGSSNTLAIINATTEEIVDTIVFKNAAFPHHVYLSADSAELALAVPGVDLSRGHDGGGHGGHGNTGAILVLDARTGQTRISRRFGSPNHNAVFSPDGKEIWTSQMTTPGKVLVLDAASLVTLNTIDVGDSPAEVTFTLDGKYAFVANGNSASVTIIDAGTKTVVKTLAVGAGPVGAWPGRDSLMYVDNESDQTITSVHGSTLEIVRTYALGFTPGMAATALNGDLWVTDADNGKVVIFPAGSVVKDGVIATGAGAHGIAFSRDGKKAFVSNQSAGTVSVVDVENRTVTKTLTVGGKPNGMVIR